jgi:alpha/beta hydrolase fold
MIPSLSSSNRAATGAVKATLMADCYPEIEPYEQGMLDVGDGQRVCWKLGGNPDGKSAVALHGGPGSGCTPGYRRNFDPDAYRIVLFDQRGAGRNTPHAGDPATDLATNTTHHLIADIELLREHLGIQRWLVWERRGEPPSRSPMRSGIRSGSVKSCLPPSR